MGYETRMYIAEVRHDIMSPMEMDNFCFYAMVVGMLDLCKTGYNSHTNELIRKQTTRDTVVFFYGSDGNTEIFTDEYDDALGVISIPAMVEALTKDIEGKERPYRRFVIAKDMLLSIMNNFDVETTYVITYGY